MKEKPEFWESTQSQPSDEWLIEALKQQKTLMQMIRGFKELMSDGSELCKDLRNNSKAHFNEQDANDAIQRLRTELIGGSVQFSSVPKSRKEVFALFSKVMKNGSLNEIKKRKLLNNSLPLEMGNAEIDKRLESKRAAFDELEMIQHVIADLTAEEQKIFHLRYVEERKLKEISMILDIPIQRLSERARKISLYLQEATKRIERGY